MRPTHKKAVPAASCKILNARVTTHRKILVATRKWTPVHPRESHLLHDFNVVQTVSFTRSAGRPGHMRFSGSSHSCTFRINRPVSLDVICDGGRSGEIKMGPLSEPEPFRIKSRYYSTRYRDSADPSNILLKATTTL